MFESMCSLLNVLEKHVYPAIDQVPEELAKSAVCMLIDYIGVKYNEKSVDIVNEILPIIEEVNGSMGTMII